MAMPSPALAHVVYRKPAFPGLTVDDQYHRLAIDLAASASPIRRRPEALVG